ncbi:hypothetical protein INR49_002788 [Caranx melampygus]|nr:hypothetical protein INR49_002788 [Caranx melampygus]
MGAENTKLAEEPFLSEPWRQIHWRNNESHLNFLKSYKPQTEGQQIRILLHGPNGAGKSSFINSVKSTLLRRMYIQALADNISGYSFTKKYTTYKIEKDPNTFYPFVFNDVMGLDQTHGVKMEDVRLALKGHLKDGYPPWELKTPNWPKNHVRLNNESHLNFLKSYKPQTEGQQIRILLHGPNGAGKSSFINSVKIHNLQDRKRPNTFYPFVFNDVMGLDQTHGVKMEDVKLALKGHLKDGYPFNPHSKITENKPLYNKSPHFNDRVHVLVLVISADTLPIMTNEMMEKLSVDIGIPMNCIFPVKNYHEEIGLDDDTDALILSALRQIINSGEDHIKFYKTFNIQKEDTNTFYPFVFNDIMGLEAKYGVLVEDIKLALKGHISQEDPFYNKSPDQVHVLVLVINADTFSIKNTEIVKKVQEIRKEASHLDIPQFAIITKIDKACREVQKDLKNIYKNNTIKEKMKILSVETGIPMNCIFPVKNYHQEIDVDDNIDTLILSALRQIIISGEDHIKHVK